jgi:predicted extracellular nuclease
MNKATIAGLAATVLALSAGTAAAQMRITEWMYSGIELEYIEFTNIGGASIDMTGWSYDDDSQVPGTVSLSSFGIVLPGESVVLAENTEAAFRAAWSLAPAIDIIGSNTTNLGRNDEINLYDSANALVDRLTYGDQTFVGSIRTQEISGNPITFAALGANDPYQWQLSFAGDAYGSYLSTGGDLGNPGSFPAVPEPSSYVLLLVGSALLVLGRKARKRFAAARAV